MASSGGDDPPDCDGPEDSKNGDYNQEDVDVLVVDAVSGDNQRGFFARVGNSYLGDALSRAQKLRSEVERLRSKGEKAESSNPPAIIDYVDGQAPGEVTEANVEDDLRNFGETSSSVGSAVTIPQASPFRARDVRDAFRLVRKSSSDATKVKFPSALFSTTISTDKVGDKDEVGAPESNASLSNSILNAYTVGRYRKMKDNEPPQNLPNSNRLLSEESSPPLVVGGADRVGLRNINMSLDDIIRGIHNPDERKQTADDKTAEGTETTVSKTTDAASEIASEEGSQAPMASSTLNKSKKSSYYEEAVRSVLEPGQRAMFYGKGTLGVILKPSYLASWKGKDGQGLLSPNTKSKGGVFIDSLIEGGHAERSGVVRVGDHIVKVGSVDVSNSTLEEVVEAISESKRPNIMILTSVHFVDSVSDDDSSHGPKYFTSALDLVYGVTNKLAEGKDLEALDSYAFKQSNSIGSLLDADEEGQREEDDETPLSLDGSENDKDNDEQDTEYSRQPTNASSASVESISSLDFGLLSAYASQPTNSSRVNRYKLTTSMKRNALFNSEFRLALRLSFDECITDPRKCSYLQHHFKNFSPQDESGQIETLKDDVASPKNQLKLLDIYVEFCRFSDAAAVCSESGKESLLDYAKQIAASFLEGDSRTIPECVSSAALGGTEQLRAVKLALKDEDIFFTEETNAFESLRSSLGSFLSSQEAYLSFLISDSCARMRAYLRDCTHPFMAIRPGHFLKQVSADDAMSHNYLLCAIFHLLCMKETDDCQEEVNFVKNDAMLLSSGDRNTGATSILSCSLFIQRNLQPSCKAVTDMLIEDGMTGGQSNSDVFLQHLKSFEDFWSIYLVPAGGSLSTLSLSGRARSALDGVRRQLVTAVDSARPTDEKHATIELAKVLSSVDTVSAISALRDALAIEYALELYPNFKRHIFHEWCCQESSCTDAIHPVIGSLRTRSFSQIPSGWSNRLLRNTDLPKGISIYRHGPRSQCLDEIESVSGSRASHVGDVAVVFGAIDDTLRRFSSIALKSGSAPGLLPEFIPPVFEQYASVPPFHERPFQGILRDSRNGRISDDGWEVSLSNVAFPSPTSSGEFAYCVSLVLRKTDLRQVSECDTASSIVHELNVISDKDVKEKLDPAAFQSPLETCESGGKVMNVTEDLTKLNFDLSSKQKCSQMNVIGLALISSENATIGMRTALSLLYDDFCTQKDRKICTGLVEFLGIFSREVEDHALRSLLLPYLSFAESKWIDRPISEQHATYLKTAGGHLLHSLPPVPLALAFLVLLLEQKVIFASSRRSVLTSASIALIELLSPLKWTHLHVPLVPITMMEELLHCPTPFALGVATDDRESASILSSIPADVTLVDLDVGRVLLASEFCLETESTTSDMRLLRSQILYLAEYLGGNFGAAINCSSWSSDSPMQASSEDTGLQLSGDFGSVSNICEEFISEILLGIPSCCLWMEEKRPSDESFNDSVIIFDEDRYFSIKSHRAEGSAPLFASKENMHKERHFALNIEYFDLILETFLRTQCLSTFISKERQDLMLFH